MADEKGKVHEASVRLQGTSSMEAEARKLSPVSADHEIIPLIGMVVASLSRVEHEMDRVIWRASGMTPEVGACVTSRLSGPHSRLDVIVMLCKHLNVPAGELRPLTSLSGQIQSVSERRNRTVHDMWYYDVDNLDPHQFRSMPKSDPVLGYVPVDATSLRTLTEETIRLRSDFLEAVARIPALSGTAAAGF